MNRLSARGMTVIGFGKIGQALAAVILKQGLPVLGLDINAALLQDFESGTFQTPEPGVEDLLKKAYREKQLRLSADFSGIPPGQAVLIAVPLLVDRKKRLLEEPFLNCFKRLAPFLKGGCVLSVETSVPVGYCRGTILPLLEKAGKRHGRDFYLVHSPERIKSGTMLRQFQKNPKIIGGLDRAAASRGERVYRQWIPKDRLRVVHSIETAEMIKLAGMVYRDVNIALANELAGFSSRLGVDITEVIAHANTDGEASLLEPGIGVGGHCTPVYPYFLIEGFRRQGMTFELAEAGRRINDGLAGIVARQILEKKVSGALLLGLAFRPGVKEDTFSTAYLLQGALQSGGVRVSLHDPIFTREEIEKKGFSCQDNLYEKSPEAVVLVTAHPAYQKLQWKKLFNAGCRYFWDGRNAVDPRRVRAAGIHYQGIGR